MCHQCARLIGASLVVRSVGEALRQPAKSDLASHRDVCRRTRTFVPDRSDAETGVGFDLGKESAAELEVGHGHVASDSPGSFIE